VSHRALTALALAGLSSGLVLSAPGAALAATHAPSHPSPHPATHQTRKPAPKLAPKRVHFAADGLVTGHTPAGTQVYVRDLHLGAKQLHNQVVTLKPHSARHLRMMAADTALPPVGDEVQATGDSNGSLTDLETVTETVTPAPAELFLGTISSVNGTTLTVAVQRAMDSSDVAESHQLTVDAAQAASTVDGAAGTLTAGQYVVILGERDHNTVLAASVVAFSTAPDSQAGTIASITGNTVTLAADDAQESTDNSTGDTPGETSGDDQAPSPPAAQPAGIDLTGVPLTLNGSPGANATGLAVGDKLLVLGTTSNGVFTPSAAYAFNGQDNAPAGDNKD